MYRVIATLCACFVALCSASDTADITDVAVGVIETIPHVGISEEKFAKWLEGTDWQQCVEQQIMELFTPRNRNPLVSQCANIVSELSSGSGGSSGDGDDRESDAVPFHVISKAFCSQACGKLFLEVYDSCGLFKNAIGQEVGSVLVESCGSSSKGVQCLDALAGFPNALQMCTADSCTSGCKESLEQAVEAAGCCLHFADMSRVTSVTEIGSGSGVGTDFTLSEALESCDIPVQRPASCQNSPLKLPGDKVVIETEGSSSSPATITLNSLVTVICLLVTGLSVIW